MLNNLRNFATTWPGKILGVFLLIGLAGFGITGVLTSIGTNTVARVGDREITIRDFQTAYQAQINNAANQLGSIPTPDQAISLGIPSRVLNQLAVDEALNILGAEFSLGVSDTKLAEGLKSVSGFSGTLGIFDREVFERVLQQNNITEKEYFDAQREAAMRQQIVMALFSQAKAPQALNNLIQRFGEDRRVLDYFVVSELSLLPVGEPDEAVLAAYLEKHQHLYRTQQIRTIRAIQLSPQVLAKRVEISEAEIAAEYERTKQSFISPELRTVTQILLRTDENVDKFQAALAGGEDFITAAANLELSVSELGRLAKGNITDPRLAQTVFEAQEGAVSIVEGALGPRAVIVTEITPVSQMSLADASERIVTRLANARGREQFVDVLDQIEEQRAAFIDLNQTADELGLTLVEIGITGRGDELVEPFGMDPAEAGRFASAVFASEIGGLAAMVPLGANKSAWYDLLSIEEARDKTLNEVRDELVTAWITEQRANALEEKANAFVAQLDTGQSVADLAVINGLFPLISQPLSRGGDGSTDIDANVAVAAFDGGVGTTGTAQNSNGDYIVFKVSSVSASVEPLSAQDAAFVENGYRDNMFSDFATALRDDAQMSVNQGVLNQILSYGATGSGLPGGGRN